MRVQFILPPPPKLQMSVHMSSKPNLLVLCNTFISIRFCSASLILFPSGSCQVDIWSHLILMDARCLFSFILTFKQHQPSLQQPVGMYANSNSPAGSLAITEPLIYSFNCKGSCFLGDQTPSLPPGRLASSLLAASGKWGCFAGELNKGCLLIEGGDSYLSWTITLAQRLVVLLDGWVTLFETSSRTTHNASTGYLSTIKHINRRL